MKPGATEEFDPQTLIPRRARNRWRVVHRNDSPVNWGYSALLAGCWVATTATPANGERGQYLWVLPIILVLAVVFAWLARRKRQKDRIALAKAAEAGGESDTRVASLSEAAKTKDQGSESLRCDSES